MNLRIPKSLKVRTSGKSQKIIEYDEAETLMKEPRKLKFFDFTLDPIQHTLHRNDDTVLLPESAQTVLEHLVSNAPETIDKETLMDIGWPDTAVIQDNLVQAIHTLRVALGGDARQPRFIQTVHRRGYRFVAPVTIINTDAPPPSPGWSQAEGRAPIETKTTRIRRALIGVLFVTLTLGLGFAALKSTNSYLKLALPQIESLAVLPLENLSGDPEQEYFADGMTDSLITELARIEALDIISRTSAMKFKNTNLTLPEIARELGVDAIVEGSVTRIEGRVRVIAQLIDAGDHHLWAENYEYKYQNILRLQRDLAQAIAREIGARVEPGPSGDLPLVVDPAAHEAFLKGHHVLRNRTKESLERAQDFFNLSISIDPKYAPAFAGLADTFNLLANYGFRPSPQTRPQAQEMARRALKLNPNLAEAHLALALVAGEYNWDFDEAEREFSIALALRPSDPVTRSRHAQLLVAMGALPEAVEEIQYSQRLDPLSEIINANVGWFLFLNGQEQAAEEQLHEVLTFSPGFAVAHYYLGVLLDHQQRFGEAISSLERARDLSKNSSYASAGLAHALARSGERHQAEEILSALLEKREKEYVSPIGLAIACFGLGQDDEGFRWLEKAFEERKGWLLHIRVEPALEDFRDDARYVDLVERIGLPEPPTWQSGETSTSP